MADKAASFTNTNTELVKMIESIKGQRTEIQ